MTTTAVGAADPGRPDVNPARTWLASLVEVAADQQAHPWHPQPTGALEDAAPGDLDYWAGRVDPAAFTGLALRVEVN